MANFENITRFQTLMENLDSFRIAKIQRPSLGPLSLNEAGKIFEDTQRQLKVVVGVAEVAPNSVIQQLNDALMQMIETFSKISTSSDQIYAAQGTDFLQQLQNARERFVTNWAVFAALALDKSGLLSDPNNLIESMREASRASTDRIEAVASEIERRAQDQAAAIEEKARKTARGISVSDAQTQFDNASRLLYRKAIAWGIASALFFAWFIIFAFHVYYHAPSGFEAKPDRANVGLIFYFAAIRITILTAIGAVATFCLQMLRAHLHMGEFNDHRRRVANSMAAFVGSVESPEQRDQIFSRLVDSVVTFGDSGILSKESDGVSVPSVAIETVTKNLTSKA